MSTPLDRINAYTAHRMGIMTKEERDATIAAGCVYCDGDRWIEQDNNGPIAACPVCNAIAEDREAYDDR